MSKDNKLRVGVIGATGYTGLELVYLLTKHPKVIIKYLCATKKIGSKINYFDQRIKKKTTKNLQYEENRLENFGCDFPISS